MAKRPPSGIDFPADAKGVRGTTETVKNVWAASFEPLDPQLPGQVLRERNWRFGYARYVRKHMQLCLADGEAAIKSAQCGLKEFYDRMEFIRDGETCSLDEALDGRFKGSYETGFIKGEGQVPEGGAAIEVPYKGRVLRGGSLKGQVQEWAAYGTIEQDTADAICEVVDSGWTEEVRSRYFVLLGTSAAMGPFKVLMALGANVIAVDYGPLDRIWKMLIQTARQSAGTLTFPLPKPQSTYASDEELWNAAGCDLLNKTPEICNWLAPLYPQEELVIGSYVYLDGGLFVRLALGADAVMREMCKRRQTKSTLAFLCTPTDCHVIPASAHNAARSNGRLSDPRNLLVLPFTLCPLRQLKLVRNVQASVNGIHWVDSIVTDQGPNYISAKRLQAWRTLVARSEGFPVSSNVAPSTSTVSVTKNRTFAWAYSGMPFFKPMEVFPQEVSNAVMTALLINDLRNPKSVANPANNVSMENPYCITGKTAFHGGTFRTGYTMGSLGGVSVLIHFLRLLRIPIILLLLAFIFIRFFL